MAEIQPLSALRYNTSVVGPLGGVTAPPYDVISTAQRAELVGRSSYNVVAVDLPQAGPASGAGIGEGDVREAELDEGGLDRGGLNRGDLNGGEVNQGDAASTSAGRLTDPYEAAGALFRSWQRAGVLVRDATPALWAHTQEYTGPDGVARTRRGFFCRVRVEEYGKGRIRPHERTHPGPKEDRLRLMRATKANLSPIFTLYSDPEHRAWEAVAPAAGQASEGEVTDSDGTVHRIWRVDDPKRIAAAQGVLSDRELLIADGHHRYETALTYAKETGGEGPHRYILMCLVAIEDPGLTVFPTHRLLRLDTERQAALAEAISRDFESREVPLEALAPDPGAGPLQLGFLDGEMRPTRLTLRDQAIADAALAGFSEAYRHLDTAALEALLLIGALHFTEKDIAELNGLSYDSTLQGAVDGIRSGEFQAALLTRPTPVSQVQGVAAAGESMPPKSTYFFPKLLTGLLFNPLDGRDTMDTTAQ